MTADRITQIIAALRARRDDATYREELIRQGVDTEGKVRRYALQHGLTPKDVLERLARGRTFVDTYPGEDLDDRYWQALLRAIATPGLLSYLIYCALGQETPPDDPDAQMLMSSLAEEFIEPI